MHKKLNDRISSRIAAARLKAGRRPLLRLLGGRGAMTVALGAALSVGGLHESFSDVHFLVQKDLDSVRVVRQRGDDQRVVANLQDGFAANTVFRTLRAFPDKLVTPQLSLFDETWISTLGVREPAGETGKSSIFDDFSSAIRQEFFASSIPFGDLIHEKSAKYNVDPALVAAVIEQESRFKIRATSPVGARGLMQLMPRTGKWMGARDLYNPEQNVDAGVKYIKYLDKRFDGNLKKTIAAYNAGEGNVRRYGGIPPFRETQTYVKKVMSNYDRRKKQLKSYEERVGTPMAEADGTVALR